jgi:hypothetical protein
MRMIPALCAVMFLAMPAGAAGWNVTLYLDGAHVENEAIMVKEQLEVPLPATMIDGSLRIKPLDGCTIERVEIVPGRPNPGPVKEMAKLAERRDSLADRLKALEAREAIFKAAAKTQSGKAPRRTKSNPEPLTTVREGTEYAIAQLEGVYRIRRKAENELQSVEARLAAMKKEGNFGGSVARVRLAKKGGRVAVSYLRSDLKWMPAYDFRLNKAGEVDVIMRAILPQTEKGAMITVVTALLAEGANEPALPAASENLLRVAAFTLPVEQEKFLAAPVSSLSFSFRNRPNGKLPAGEASVYRRGEYLGKAAFAGAAPGEVKELAVGR